MCPKCDEPLVIIEFEGVEVDHCLECRGTWFDAGELELVAELAGAAAGRIEQTLHAGQGRRSEFRCPRCRRHLLAVGIGEPAIEIDRCPGGDGLWLDAGELADVVRQLTTGDDAALAAFFGEMFQHELSEDREEH